MVEHLKQQLTPPSQVFGASEYFSPSLKIQKMPNYEYDPCRKQMAEFIDAELIISILRREIFESI